MKKRIKSYYWFIHLVIALARQNRSNCIKCKLKQMWIKRLSRLFWHMKSVFFYSYIYAHFQLVWKHEVAWLQLILLSLSTTVAWMVLVFHLRCFVWLSLQLQIQSWWLVRRIEIPTSTMQENLISTQMDYQPNYSNCLMQCYTFLYFYLIPI